MIIYGTRLFGKCDEIPGAGHVATQFFHVYYLPLIPMKSHFVIEGSKSGDGYKAIALDLSWRSVGFAWLRAVAALGLIGGCAVSFIAADESHNMVVGIAGAVASIVTMAALVWASYRLARPSEQRIGALKQQLGLVTVGAPQVPTVTKF